MGFAFKDGARLLMGLADDNGYSSFYDAGFLRGYLGQCVAQELGMVEADIGDDGNQRGDDVRAVQPSAQAYLDDSDVDVHVTEVLEGHGCRHLKERGMERFQESALALNKINDIRLADWTAIDADALTKINQVG